MKKMTPSRTHVFTVHSKSDSMAGTCRMLLDMFLGARRSVEPFWNSTTHAHQATNRVQWMISKITERGGLACPRSVMIESSICADKAQDLAREACCHRRLLAFWPLWCLTWEQRWVGGGGPQFLDVGKKCKVGASVTTDQACASCIRPSSLVLCKSEVVVVGFQLQIAGFGGSSVRLRTGAFSFRLLGACFQSQADVSRHAASATSLSLHTSPSGCWSAPTKPAGPRSCRAAEIGIGCVLCAVAGVELVAELIEH
jgi:hypothetical protein